jgi:hypothetical protein
LDLEKLTKERKERTRPARPRQCMHAWIDRSCMHPESNSLACIFFLFFITRQHDSLGSLAKLETCWRNQARSWERIGHHVQNQLFYFLHRSTSRRRMEPRALHRNMLRIKLTRKQPDDAWINAFFFLLSLQPNLAQEKFAILNTSLIHVRSSSRWPCSITVVEGSCSGFRPVSR